MQHLINMITAFVRAVWQRCRQALVRIGEHSRHPQRTRVRSDAASALPVSAPLTGDAPFLPSEERPLRHLKRILVRWGMIACLIGALCCALAVPLLSSFRVKSVQTVGLSHYEADELLTVAGIRIGDELFRCSPDKIEAELLKKLPYLRSVKVRRTLGKLTLEVIESKPCWALSLENGRVALMDAERYVAEVCRADAVPEGLCALSMPLPPLEKIVDDETLMEPQIPSAGRSIVGSSAALTLFDDIQRALETVSLHAAPAHLDLTDAYAVGLTLQDGTYLALYDCADAMRQLEGAAASIEVYLATHPNATENAWLYVDARDFLRISIRTIPKNTAENDANDDFSEKN